MHPRYAATLDYLYSQLPMYQRVGAKAFKKDLTNTLDLLALAGNPHHAWKSIHVAGTNGKGSVSHLISAALQAAGYKVGLYTSPHYRDFRERIKINGVYISEADVVAFTDRYRADFERIAPSYFEMTVAMAFAYFAQEKVDIAVIETGLGGRLDSTNVITPLLSVITNISFDHTDLLGDTLPQIAAEKAGIIKAGVPVVIGEYQPDTLSVFAATAADRRAPRYLAPDLWTLTRQTAHFSKTTYTATDANGNVLSVASDLWGNYQLLNVRTALAAISVWNEHTPHHIATDALLHGFAHTRPLTRLIGRWEVLGTAPLVLADSAHNESGIGQLVAQLTTLSYRRLHLVWGGLRDKSLAPLLAQLPREATYYFAKPDVPRGLDAGALQAQAADFQLFGKIYGSVSEALAAARAAAHTDDLVLVGGSIFVVAEVILG